MDGEKTGTSKQRIGIYKDNIDTLDKTGKDRGKIK